MKISIGRLRLLIRETLGAAASVSDPTDVKGFYPYEIERGTDVHGYWYRSPGRPMGGDGDPFRPADAAEYIGMKPPPDNPVDTPGADAAADVKPTDVMPDVAGSDNTIETTEEEV